MSGIGTGMAIAAGVGAAGSIAGGIMGSSAASNAADAQVQAAQIAQQGQEKIAQENIAQQNKTIGEQLKLISPWYNTGQAGLANLAYQLGIPDIGTIVNPQQLNGTGTTAAPNLPKLGGSASGSTGGVNTPTLGGNNGGSPIPPLQTAAQPGPIVPEGGPGGGPGNPSITGPNESTGTPATQNGSGSIGLMPGGVQTPTQANTFAQYQAWVAAGRPGTFQQWSQQHPGTGAPASGGGTAAGQPGTNPATSVGGAPAGVNTAAGQPLTNLVNPALGGYGSIYQGLATPFVAPTNVTEQNDPGYQFRLQQGMNTLDSGAAARGSILTGGTAKAEQMYGQEYASGEYGNVYNRAVNQYGLNRQSYLDRYNALANMSGMGQLSAGQGAGFVGNAGQNIGNTLNLLSSQFGQNANNIGAANASGYIGSANAITGAIGGATNSLSQYAMMNALLNGQNANPNLLASINF